MRGTIWYEINRNVRILALSDNLFHDTCLVIWQVTQSVSDIIKTRKLSRKLTLMCKNFPDNNFPPLSPLPSIIMKYVRLQSVALHLVLQVHFFVCYCKVLRYFGYFKYLSKSVWKVFQIVQKLSSVSETFQCQESVWKLSMMSGNFTNILETFQIIQKLVRKRTRGSGNSSRLSRIFQICPTIFCH